MTASTCPSDLALESFLLDPERSRLAPHVDGCQSCLARVARMRDEGEEFRQYVFPATVDAVEAAATRKRFNWRALFAPIGALAAAAAALVLVVRVSGPGDDYVGVKGSGLNLAVWVGAADGARAVEDGASVPASAAIRFTVAPEKGECFLWILSVDAAGEVSRIYPPQGAAPVKHGRGEVPGGAVLDGKGGPERVYAVCGAEPMGWETVKGAAAKAAAGGPQAVRSAKGIPDLPRAFSQASLLLEKTP